MTKKIIAAILVLLLLVAIPINAYAATPRTLAVIPRLLFSGTTATCAVTVTGYTSTDEIEIVVKLWNGSRCLKTWTASNTGYVFFSEEYTVTKGKTYTLTTDVTVNGTTEPRISISETCE